MLQTLPIGLTLGFTHGYKMFWIY